MPPAEASRAEDSWPNAGKVGNSSSLFSGDEQLLNTSLGNWSYVYG